jgi:hypothetical protein
VNETAAFGAGAIARVRGAPAWTITAAGGLLYVIAAPPSTDLAAAAYRSNLFSRVGFTLWDNSWYGGHHLLAYSLLAPALGALIGPQLVAAISMTLVAVLFARLLDRVFDRRATRIASVWLACGAAISLLANRVPFDLGLAIGMGALILSRAAQERRRLRAAAVGLSLLTAAASPVAGAFLALALLAWALAALFPARPEGDRAAAEEETERASAAARGRDSDEGRGDDSTEGQGRGAALWPLAPAVAALAPIVLLALAFPEGGSQPFAPSSFYPALIGALFILAVIPASQRAVRNGALLYAAALLGAYVLPTAVGGNADRLGALFAGPLAACVLATRGRRAARLLVAVAPLLIYWQVNAPLDDFSAAHSDPAVNSSYYAPLLDELRALGVGYAARPARIEVVPANDHWEARWVAPFIPLARGWERQLDTRENALFYEESKPLTAARYRAWLSEEAVSYVALPDYALDYSAKAEARLLRGGPPGYLREVWRSAHWRLFAVIGARALAEEPATLTAISTDSFTLEAPSAGAFTVRVHFTPYWALQSGLGCVSRAPGDWTEVRARAPGRLRVGIVFSLARVFDRGSRCD